MANPARDWMAARAEDLLPVESFHAVFTLPVEAARIVAMPLILVLGLLCWSLIRSLRENSGRKVELPRVVVPPAAE